MIGVINYEINNLRSITNFLQEQHLDFLIVNDPKMLNNCDRLILPGVGSFGRGMQSLDKQGLSSEIVAFAKSGKPVLGICLGMQLLGSSSSEDGETDGLGLIDARIDQFDKGLTKDLKIPHVGFDLVQSGNGSRLFKDMPYENDFYFVHEYRMQNTLREGVSSTCSYGETFLAAYEFENILATQFHPEKSQANGLKLLSNFLELT